MVNFIIRENNIGRIISVDGMVDAVDIEQTLKSKYNYLYQSMLDNNFQVKVNHCTYFKEIVFKKNVVGFCAYTIINSVTNLSLVSTYILPDFRKKGLFFDEINNIYEEGKEITIFEPPCFVMELLINYGFAKKISDNLIVSSIKLDIPSTSISNIYGTDDVEYSDYTYSTNIYDSYLCGSLIIQDMEKEVVYLSKSAKNDDDLYNCLEKREKINDEYFKKVLKTIKDNENLINKFFNDIDRTFGQVENDFDQNLDFNEIELIKKEENQKELSNYFDKLDTDNNTLLDDESLIDKEKYVLTYQNVGIYDFIHTFKENNNIELTNSIINIDCEFEQDYIKNLVISEGYISNEPTQSEKEEYLHSLKVTQLKNLLKENNLTVTGNKSKLIERIMEYIPSSNIIEKEYYITEKGLTFIDEHEDIHFYNLYLKNFYYYEFNEFLSENDGDINDVCKDFLKKHLEKSIIKKDNKAYNDSINALAYINELNNNIQEGLYYELKRFIVGLNPIFLDEKSYNYYQPISKNNIDNINLLLFKGDFDLKEEFKKAWDEIEIKNFSVPYDKSFKTLNQMLSGEDRDYMNDKIREKYLSKDNIIHDKLDKSKQSTLDIYLDK